MSGNAVFLEELSCCDCEDGTEGGRARQLFMASAYFARGREAPPEKQKRTFPRSNANAN